ncbi:hypothetical protein Q0P45_14035, partial [Staphylococcus aureus]|nr:hypothetical protein [Staphylococcus aureus]
AVATDGLELRGRNGVHIVYDSEPYGPDEQGLAVFVKPIKDECELELQFIVPDVAHLHEVKVSGRRRAWH